MRNMKFSSPSQVLKERPFLPPLLSKRPGLHYEVVQLLKNFKMCEDVFSLQKTKFPPVEHTCGYYLNNHVA